jgi:hypothetical protein
MTATITGESNQGMTTLAIMERFASFDLGSKIESLRNESHETMYFLTLQGACGVPKPMTSRMHAICPFQTASCLTMSVALRDRVRCAEMLRDEIQPSCRTLDFTAVSGRRRVQNGKAYKSK